jgi:hypothetical protein
MLPSEFGHMLNVALRDLESSISLTLTSVSDDSNHLQKLLTTAMAAGRRHGARLIGIQLPMDNFPLFGTRFRNVPISNSGDPGVMRFEFEPSAPYNSFEAAA